MVAKAYGETIVSRTSPSPLRVQSRVPRKASRQRLALLGTSPDGRLVEFIELDDHPFWVGTQAHPEFKSRPTNPAPLFRELVGAVVDRAEAAIRSFPRWT